MTADNQSTDDLRLEEAAAWVVRLQGGDEADALAFDAWLGASLDNAEAYDRVIAVRDAYVAAAPDILRELDDDKRRRERRFALQPAWLGVGGLAAAATLALVVLPPLLAEAPTRTYSTATGERRTIRLDDGSTVDLNAASTLSVTLGRHERRVVMGEGEAVFDVAHEARRPFLITAGDRTVRVVGTQFDVRRRGEDLAVTVARGLVEVRSRDAVERAWRLHPGQQLQRHASGPEIIAAAAPEEVFGWRTGRLVYRDQPLSEVVEDLNLQFARPIRLDDPSLGDVRVSGVLVLDSQEAVIRRLALLSPISAVTSGDSVLLRRQGTAEQ